MTSLPTPFILLLLVSAGVGCVSKRISDPARTATEQFLLSTAADRALAAVALPLDGDPAVFLRDVNLEAYDRLYLVAALRLLITREGGRLMSTEADAVVFVEPRSGALSTDVDTFLIGIPSFEIPLPLVTSGPLKTPELALFKRDRRRGLAKLAVAVYDAEGRLVADVGPVLGESRTIDWTLLFIPWTTSDLEPAID